MKLLAKRFVSGLCLLLLLGVLTACGQFYHFKQTVRSGLTTLPWPKQMEALFGGKVDSFISNFGGASGPQVWNTVVYFDGRQELTLQMNVDIDYQNDRIIRTTSPLRFCLVEADTATASGSSSSSKGWFFDETQWNKLVAAKGDWRVLGILLNKTLLPDWDEYVKKWRGPRKL